MIAARMPRYVWHADVHVPGPATFRIAGQKVHVPLGETRAVAADSGDYEIVPDEGERMGKSRVVKQFTCNRCGTVNPDYLTFGVGRNKNYCLHHIPHLVRLKMWWRERREIRRDRKAATVPGE